MCDPVGATAAEAPAAGAAELCATAERGVKAMAEPSAIKAMVLSIVFILQGEFVRTARSSVCQLL